MYTSHSYNTPKRREQRLQAEKTTQQEQQNAALAAAQLQSEQVPTTLFLLTLLFQTSFCTWNGNDW